MKTMAPHEGGSLAIYHAHRHQPQTSAPIVCPCAGVPLVYVLPGELAVMPDKQMKHLDHLHAPKLVYILSIFTGEDHNIWM